MKREHLAVYIAALMLGVLGGVCLPKAWYQQPAPKFAVLHTGTHAQPSLLADRR
jgi:hypothetical protein